MESGKIARQVARRRSFAIACHPDPGKTALTEKLLLFSGPIHIAGSVKARKASRDATSDWMETENFSEDTYRVLTAVDAALMVIDAAKGAEPQTLKLLAVCRARHAGLGQARGAC